MVNKNFPKKLLPNLDGIRAIACLLVVISHMPLPVDTSIPAATGVGIFFVLSGFLMSYLYGSVQWNTKTVFKYGIARFSRVVPIYWLVISICIFISYIQPSSDFPMRINGELQIFRHYLFGGSVGVFWSIPPEIQYYIFFIFIWWSLANQSKLSYALPLLALVCASLIMTHTHWPGLALPNKLHLFLAGSIAGLIPRFSWNEKKEKCALFILQIGAIIILIVPLWLYTNKEDLYRAPDIGLTIAIAIYLLSIPSKWTAFIFASQPMRKIGQASFSIYLIHVLIFHFGSLFLGVSKTKYDPLWLILGVAGVVLPIIISHYIELPLQKITKKFLEKLISIKNKLSPSN